MTFHTSQLNWPKYIIQCESNILSSDETRGVFGTLPNIYDEAFFAKIASCFWPLATLQKSFVVDVLQVPKYAFQINNGEFNKEAAILIIHNEMFARLQTDPDNDCCW